MKNKLLVNKMKNNAELAMAAYGYYDLITNNTNQSFIILKDEKGNDKTDSDGNPITKQINLTDILDITYKDYKVYIPSRLPTIPPEKVGTLKGDFSPTQAKNFLKKYDILIHQPNTHSGFSATLFYDKEKDRFVAGFRGTECRF